MQVKNASVAEMGAWGPGGWSWNELQVTDFSDEETSSAAGLAELLLGVAPTRDIADRWSWTLNPIFGFTVKNCYGWLLSFFAGERGCLDDHRVNACIKLWRNDVPSKVLIFAWRLLLNKLATKDALARRGVIHSNQNMECALCSDDEESVQHLFLGCQFSREVWRQVAQWMGVPMVSEDNVVDNFVAFGKHLKGKERKRVKHLVWIAVVWCLWSSRNNRIFRGEAASVPAIVDAIKFMSWSWFIARRGRRSGVSWNDWLGSPMGCFLSL